MCAAMPMLRVRSSVYSRLGELTGLASADINQFFFNFSGGFPMKSALNLQNGAWNIREKGLVAIRFFPLRGFIPVARHKAPAPAIQWISHCDQTTMRYCLEYEGGHTISPVWRCVRHLHHKPPKGFVQRLEVLFIRQLFSPGR